MGCPKSNRHLNILLKGNINIVIIELRVPEHCNLSQHYFTSSKLVQLYHTFASSCNLNCSIRKELNLSLSLHDVVVGQPRSWIIEVISNKKSIAFIWNRIMIHKWFEIPTKNWKSKFTPVFDCQDAVPTTGGLRYIGLLFTMAVTSLTFARRQLLIASHTAVTSANQHALRANSLWGSCDPHDRVASCYQRDPFARWFAFTSMCDSFMSVKLKKASVGGMIVFSFGREKVMSLWGI